MGLHFFNKTKMSSSERTTAIKMLCNVAAVQAVPGWNTFPLCQITGCEEIETLGYVLASCRNGKLLCNKRHHTAQSAIAEEFKKIG